MNIIVIYCKMYKTEPVPFVQNVQNRTGTKCTRGGRTWEYLAKYLKAIVKKK